MVRVDVLSETSSNARNRWVALQVCGCIKTSAVVPFYEPAVRLCSSATFVCYASGRETLTCG